MPKARVGGGDIAYETRGAGPALLFLHAFPLGLGMWEPQVSAFASSHQVIRFDARGFGGSPPGDGLLTMERIADDAVGLLDHLDVSRAIVCGLSMGGYAAFALVRRHADRLKALVLADTRAGADSDAARAARAAQADKVRKEGSASIADAVLPKLVGETTHAQRPELVARLKETIAANPPRGIADALAGLAARADSTSTLREVRVPTLVVCGAEDVLTPVSESEALVRGIAGSKLEVIPGAGHLSSVENPDQFNAVLRKFLTALH
jgi:3-oxoadipate enol-lactonase